MWETSSGVQLRSTAHPSSTQPLPTRIFADPQHLIYTIMSSVDFETNINCGCFFPNCPTPSLSQNIFFENLKNCCTSPELMINREVGLGSSTSLSPRESHVGPKSGNYRQ